ncbi:MAG: sigma-54 dependent transcriptional regulator [Deferribacteraceae bacterium]|jgi:two-component system nitrogen regulation response regulator NtrX|nr:sigma-54 dependent transcriptional regulator [Deferribacteraceae bacterium]
MKVLVIDDEKNICLAIQGILEDEGYTCQYRLNFADGFKALKDEQFDVVFLDIWLPDKDGTEGLRDIKRYMSDVEVVMISGHGNIENAVDSIRWGAYDFLEKPLSMERILVIVKHLQDKLRLMQDLRDSRFNLLKRYDLIGNSHAITSVRKKIEKIAPTNAWVLVTGENGTGKEHVARLIHMLSKRNDKPFVEINCSAVPSELVESELFGHEKGAFTNAVAKKLGRVELADGGTLFLDEIGDMELSMQAKLLRVLENSTFTRVGGTEVITSDFRLIAATNKDLEAEISVNNFREDLYYRINVIPVEVPPLRVRRDDIPLLMNHFLEEACSLNNLTLKQFSPELVELFCNYDWPGNVRQLKNVVERMLVLAEKDTLDVADVPEYLKKGGSVIEEVVIPMDNTLKDARDEFEKQYILKALRACGWNVRKASQLLDIDRTYLHRKIKAYEIDKLRGE